MSHASFCWSCSRKLTAVVAEIDFDGTVLRVHKSCKKEALATLYPRHSYPAAAKVLQPSDDCEWEMLMGVRA